MKRFIPLLLLLPLCAYATSVVVDGVSVIDCTLGAYEWNRGGTLIRVNLHNRTSSPKTLRFAHPNQAYSWGDYGRITYTATVPANGDSLVEIPHLVGNISGNDNLLGITDSSGHSVELHISGGDYQNWNHATDLYATPSAKPAVLKEVVPAKSGGYSISTDVRYDLSSAFADPWPSDFRAYMRYSACLLTADEFADLPDPARAALADYAAAGGLLCVFGADAPPDLPLAHTGTGTVQDGIRIVPVGYGSVAAIPAASAEDLYSSARTNLLSLANLTDKRLVENAKNDLPFHDPLVEHSPSVLAVFLLLVAFAVLAGPVLLRRLAKRNQRIRILWMLPALSLAICLLLVVVMLVANGITPEVSRSAIVLLDQAAGRAAITGRITILAPHALVSGPSIERDAILDVTGKREGSASSRNIVLGPALQLSRGWLRPGIPCVLHTRAVRPTHLRLDVTEPADGSAPTIRNLLGAPVKRLFLWDTSGALHSGPALAPGDSRTLTANTSKIPDDLFNDLNKTVFCQAGPSHPRRRFYVAELDGPESPFLADPLDGRRARHTARTLVLGTY